MVDWLLVEVGRLVLEVDAVELSKGRKPLQVRFPVLQLSQFPLDCLVFGAQLVGLNLQVPEQHRLVVQSGQGLFQLTL